MSREADHTIKGFLYQFNKTLNAILMSNEKENLQIEGIIEDIDIESSNLTSAIQCKYHESNTQFNLSDIYKPVLQMLCHYLESGNSNIKYILYAYFPNEKVGFKRITISQLEEITSTNNFDYINKYVSKIKPPKDKQIEEILKKPRKTTEEKAKIREYYKSNDLESVVDLRKFLKDHFVFEIGHSYDSLAHETKKLLEAEGFSTDDVNDLFYPNAIQYIAEISIIPEERKRITNKIELIGFLNKSKKTAMSRWTSELLSRKELLKIKRKQLMPSLNANSRLRYFLIDPDYIEDFDDEFILFVKEYLEKYNSKIKLHTYTPCFFIKTNTNKLSEYHQRFVLKGIPIITGYIGDTFLFEEFNRDPKRIVKDNWVEFKAKITCISDDIKAYINTKKCDDLYVLGDINTSVLDTVDVNIEQITINDFKELKYILSIIKEV
ncbi:MULTISPECIES: hypothetical protein [Allobacillus]|uniref:Uncharacterized protein n=1 Tax=Allobacillus salarius TaxID=1955272 RepID=A0A556P6F1_9BACI|nr:hypothetical protein [Allobacillus salarius]TSJ59965.1 hypothetical protein FPQ13_12750 [Allobacillus salarius]